MDPSRTPGPGKSKIANIPSGRRTAVEQRRNPAARGGASAEEYIAKQKPDQQTILKKLRSIIMKAAPQLSEQIKYGFPWYVEKENVCVIMAAGTWVDLGFYRGTELKDPKELLEGSGKGMRHIKVRTLNEIDSEYFTQLVKQAASLTPRK